MASALPHTTGAVGARFFLRLSQMNDNSNSPDKQVRHVRGVARKNGAHIIAWVQDWDVSGAVDPMERKGFGPRLRDEMGPYDGIAASAVDQIGRDLLSVLSVGRHMTLTRRLILTHDHDGPWDLKDENDEQQFTFKALLAQGELRSIQRRTGQTAVNMREIGRKYERISYGFKYVPVGDGWVVDHIALDQEAADVMREAARRIATAWQNRKPDRRATISCSTEIKRLNQAGVLSPNDHRAVQYGKEPKGIPWSAKTLRCILISKAALGYLMHDGRPVLDREGRPIRIRKEQLWDSSMHKVLVEACTPQRSDKGRAAKSSAMLIELTDCGLCTVPIRIHSHKKDERTYRCLGRQNGLPQSNGCQPAPSMPIDEADKYVAEWFLNRFGVTELSEQFYDPGTDVGARIVNLKGDRERLREDRAAGLYNSAEDTEWYRQTLIAMGEQLAELEKIPLREPGMYWRPTGRTVADEWNAAVSAVARREILRDYGSE